LVLKNYKLTVAYDGFGYFGWQEQKGLQTIEGVIKDALYSLTERTLLISVAGRTDKNVHALGQVFNFKTDWKLPLNKLSYLLNKRLPVSVKVIKAEEVSDSFHARFSAKAREYIYLLVSRKSGCPIYYKRYIGLVDNMKNLNIHLMRCAAKLLLGEKNFKSFCSSGSTERTFVRNVHNLTISQASFSGLFGEKIDIIKIKIKANAFLYHMVRNIVSVLSDIGVGKISLEKLGVILDKKDRSLYGPPAPAEGLYLTKVYY